MQQRVKEAEDRERPQIEAAGVDPYIHRAAIADSAGKAADDHRRHRIALCIGRDRPVAREFGQIARPAEPRQKTRSEEHTSALQSLMRISYAVFCLKKKQNK